MTENHTTKTDTDSSADQRNALGRFIRIDAARSVGAYHAPNDSFLFELMNDGERVRLRLSFDAVMAMSQLAIELSAPRISA